MKLNSKTIAAIDTPGRYPDGHGLYLQVTAGSKSWVLRYERAGRERMMGLGALHLVGLAEARKRAHRARMLLLDGLDPLAEKQAQRAVKAVPTITFKQAAKTYYKDHADKWHAKHRFLKSLEDYAFDKIGHMDVAAINTDNVLSVVKPLWSEKNETMVKVARRIATVLDWAIVSGYRKETNPAIWKGRLALLLPAPASIVKVVHRAALPFAEAPAFMEALRQREGTDARALEFTILTAVRTSEALGARWSEVDFATSTWTIPGSRTKTRLPMRVALSEPALALLRGLPREDENPHVFLGRFTGRSLGENAMIAVLREMRPGITVHGFRSTFRDYCAERTDVQNHIAEAALGHRIKSEVERAYRRGDLLEKRRALMSDWAAYCGGAAAADNVVPLRAAQ